MPLKRIFRLLVVRRFAGVLARRDIESADNFRFLQLSGVNRLSTFFFFFKFCFLIWGQPRQVVFVYVRLIQFGVSGNHVHPAHTALCWCSFGALPPIRPVRRTEWAWISSWLTDSCLAQLLELYTFYVSRAGSLLDSASARVPDDTCTGVSSTHLVRPLWAPKCSFLQTSDFLFLSEVQPFWAPTKQHTHLSSCGHVTFSPTEITSVSETSNTTGSTWLPKIQDLMRYWVSSNQTASPVFTALIS